MNNKEKAVLYFLIVSLLIGAGVSLYKNQKTQKTLINIETDTLTIADTVKNLSLKSESIKSKKGEFNTLIDINQATANELEALPGIGPVLAQRIIEERNRVGKFSNQEDLIKVKGIGKKKLAKIKDKIIIKP
jgi:comEA protein